MNDLLFGVSIEEIERITGESQKVIKKWKKGTKQIPEPALRLLKLYLSGDASALLGDEWKGYRFTNSLIFVPEWRNRFTPHEIRAFFWILAALCILLVGLSELRPLWRDQSIFSLW